MEKDFVHRGKSTFRIEESCMPPLQSGRYIVTSEQSVEKMGEGAKVTEEFLVEGPRFCLPQTEIDSVYPPDGTKGSYGGILPQIVFKRKTLPWERSVEKERQSGRYGSEGKRPMREIPWLLLLTLRESESADLKTGTAEEMAAVPPKVFFPKLTMTEAEKKQKCTYMDLDMGLFQSIAPKPKELALLCHAREVNLENRVCVGDESPWVSVLAGNRLPEVSESGALNRSYLISVESFGDYSQLDIAEYKSIRVPVLYQWHYLCMPRGESFTELFEQLKCRRFCSHSGEAQGAWGAGGYYPVEHRLRNGAKTVSLYRGALIPHMERFEEDDIDAVADVDGLYQYAADMGLFDISYAAAWQLGKLLALNHRAAAEALMDVQEKNHQTALRQKQQNALRKHLNCSRDEDVVGVVLQMLEETL